MLAVVWHYWIGVLIAVPAVVVTIAYVAMFLRKTQAPKYSRDD